MLKKTLTILLLSLLFSCSKDDNTPEPENPAKSEFRIKQVIYPNGTLEYEYNAQNKIAKITNPNGSFRKYEYNTKGQILSFQRLGNIDPTDNNRVDYVYNSDGIKMEEITTESGSKYKYVYTNSNGLPVESRYYNWNTTTNLWVESTGSKITYIYNSNNKVLRTQGENYYALNAYDSRGNTTEYKQYSKKSDATYFLSYQVNQNFDDKKAIAYNPFTNVTINNILDFISKTYLENGFLSNQSSGTYLYEYNEAGYVTKQSYNGALFATFTLEKVN